METEEYALFQLPDWLEDWRVADELFTEAYDNCKPKWRAALKTGLALASFHFKKTGQVEKHEISSKNDGIIAYAKQEPCTWAAIIFEASLSASARLCAALAAPALANVPNILAVALGESISLPALVALELCGISDVFLHSEKSPQALGAELVQELRASGSGKICFLHSGGFGACAFPENDAHYLQLSAKANIFVDEPDLFDPETLAFCQDLQPGMHDPEKQLDCVFTARKGLHPEFDAALLLGPGCEGFWLYPAYDPLLFMSGQQAFNLLF